jgi:hypothetical protein
VGQENEMPVIRDPKDSIIAKKVDPADAAERAAVRAERITNATRATEGYAELERAKEQKAALQSDPQG